MRRGLIYFLLAGMLLLAPATGRADFAPPDAGELETWMQEIRELARGMAPINDPGAEDADSEDGYALQYSFGTVFADQPTLEGETRINALQVMDAGIPGPRGICVSWEVNRVMEAIPCDNPEMKGTPQAAALYLEGDPETGYLYGLAEREGQRVLALEYGAVSLPEGRKISLTLLIRDDGVDALRAEDSGAGFSREEGEELYRRLKELTGETGYARVPRSGTGTDLEAFREEDLTFGGVSYLTAVPRDFEDRDVEEMLMDNEDGTWLRRIDGDGFEAVFVTDSRGEDARLISYTILDPGAEGPRGVRLGDLFQEDFSRFRSGEGELDPETMTEILYGVPGTAPWGLAEYGNGTEMILRYAAPARDGRTVELMLRYEGTVLTEITLHTLEEDEKDAD